MNTGYSYNGDGLRVSKTVSGTATPEVWDLAEGLPLVVQDGTTKYITGPDGLPIEQVDKSGAIGYYLQDQLGSTRGLIDSSGNVVATFNYDAYGNPTGHTGTITTPFGYAGQYTDAESGLQYLRAPYYDPATEQFLTVDPAVVETGEPYAYSADAPLSWTDPTGLCAANSSENQGFTFFQGKHGKKCRITISDIELHHGSPHFHIRVDTQAGLHPYQNYHVIYDSQSGQSVLYGRKKSAGEYAFGSLLWLLVPVTRWTIR